MRSDKRVSAHIKDIRSAAFEAISFVESLIFEGFESDRKTRGAL